MRNAFASLAQVLSFDVVTLGARLKALKSADDRTMMVFTTVLADAVRVCIAAWIVIVIL